MKPMTVPIRTLLRAAGPELQRTLQTMALGAQVPLRRLLDASPKGWLDVAWAVRFVPDLMPEDESRLAHEIVIAYLDHHGLVLLAPAQQQALKAFLRTTGQRQLTFLAAKRMADSSYGASAYFARAVLAAAEARDDVNKVFDAALFAWLGANCGYNPENHHAGHVAVLQWLDQMEAGAND